MFLLLNLLKYVYRLISSQNLLLADTHVLLASECADWQPGNDYTVGSYKDSFSTYGTYTEVVQCNSSRCYNSNEL